MKNVYFTHLKKIYIFGFNGRFRVFAKTSLKSFFPKMNSSNQKTLFAVLGIKIGQETAEKELLDKNRESGPECTLDISRKQGKKYRDKKIMQKFFIGKFICIEIIFKIDN